MHVASAVQLQPPPVNGSEGAEAAGQDGAWDHQRLGWKEVLRSVCTVQVPAADANSSLWLYHQLWSRHTTSMG